MYRKTMHDVFLRMSRVWEPLHSLRITTSSLICWPVHHSGTLNAGQLLSQVPALTVYTWQHYASRPPERFSTTPLFPLLHTEGRSSPAWDRPDWWTGWEWSHYSYLCTEWVRRKCWIEEGAGCGCPTVALWRLGSMTRRPLLEKICGFHPKAKKGGERLERSLKPHRPSELRSRWDRELSLWRLESFLFLMRHLWDCWDQSPFRNSSSPRLRPESQTFSSSCDESCRYRTFFHSLGRGSNSCLCLQK